MSFNHTVKLSRRGHEYGVVHLESPETASLRDILTKYVQISGDRFEELLWLGSIYHKDKRLLDNIVIQTGDYLRVHTNPRRFDVHSLKYPDLILANTEEYIVIHKPSGIPVHASVDNLHENALSVISKKMNIELKITNRLDVATEGLLLYAKTISYQAKFNEYLSKGMIKKIYRAVIHMNQALPLGKLVHYMEPSPRAPKRVGAEPKLGWQDCVLIVLEVNSIDAETAEVFIELVTGRTHQIRAQLSAVGCPIVGDVQYGSPVHLSDLQDHIKLQSYSLHIPGAPTYELKHSLLFKK